MAMRMQPSVKIKAKNKPLIAQGVARQLEKYADMKKQGVSLTQSFLHRLGREYRVLEVNGEYRMMVVVDPWFVLNTLEAFTDRTLREAVNACLKEDGYFLRVEGLSKGTEHLKVWVGLAGILGEEQFNKYKAVQNGDSSLLFSLIAKQINHI